jgi:hypothetical protein
MKAPIKILYVFALIFLLGACHYQCDCLPQTEWLIFGRYHGKCVGDCAHFYKLTPNALFKDDIERFQIAENVSFVTTPMPESKFQKARVLLTEFPYALLGEDADTFGCPDCADQGGYYLELRREGKTYRWRIDTREEELPSYLVAYTRRMNMVLEQLH